jgi:hypothetical protein
MLESTPTVLSSGDTGALSDALGSSKDTADCHVHERGKEICGNELQPIYFRQ